MITELDAGTIANLPGWDYPLPASQVHEILEQACTPGIYRVSLADRHGRARLRARHGAIGDARRLGEPRDMVEVSAPVVLRGETVAVVRVAGAPDESTALEDAARLTAARLGDAWAAAQEIDSLAGEIVHAYEELHLLYELGEALTGQFTVAQAAELVLDKIRHALHAAWAELRLNDDERPVHVTSRQRAGPFGAHRITAEHRLSATLRSGGQTIGSIVLLRTRDDDPFSSADSKLLDAVAIFAGSAIRNGQLYQELRRQADTDALTGLLNHRALQERLDERLDAARSRDETLGILMLDVDDFKLFNDSYGHLVGDQILRLVGEVVREICGEDGVVGRYGGDEFVLALPGVDRAGLGAVAQRLHETMIGRGVPVHGHEMVPVSLSIGCALFPEDGPVKNELLSRADAALYEAKRRDGREAPAPEPAPEEAAVADSTTFGVLQGLVNAVDAKDAYTRGHAQAVTEGALLLARELGLSTEVCSALRIAGLLHDVGKIGIPDRILRKPGRLSEDEQRIMQQHVSLSELIIKEVPHLVDVLGAVASHHERYDGGGYPRGLRGEEIPLMGRIMALADACSAMLVNRPYRKGLSWPEVAAELRRGKGAQFDPELVEPFIGAIERSEFLRRVGLPPTP